MQKVSVLLILLLLILGLSACTPEQRTPNEGTWYCAELQSQFSVDRGNGFVPKDDVNAVDESENYVIVDGDRIAALLSNDRGSIQVYIICQESDNPHYKLGDIIYSLEFVDLSNTEYILKDEAGKIYTFLRVDDESCD